MFNPIEDRIILKTLEDETTTTTGGVIMPDMGLDGSLHLLGDVIAAGPGLNSLVNIKRCEMQCKVGDKVLFPKNLAKKVEVEEEEYYIIKECEVLTIIKESK